MLPTQPTAHK